MEIEFKSTSQSIRVTHPHYKCFFCILFLVFETKYLNIHVQFINFLLPTIISLISCIKQFICRKELSICCTIILFTKMLPHKEPKRVCMVQICVESNGRNRSQQKHEGRCFKDEFRYKGTMRETLLVEGTRKITAAPWTA